jgi:hypothetical protein
MGVWEALFLARRRRSPCPAWHQAMRCTLACLRHARAAMMQTPDLGDGNPSSPPRRLDDARESGVVVQSAAACLLAESPDATRCVKGFDDFVASIAAPTATGWNDSCRAGFPPAEDARLGTAHSNLTLCEFRIEWSQL